MKSSDNPADALTKGIPDGPLIKWLDGPSFLRSPEEHPHFFEPEKEIIKTSVVGGEE